MQTIELGHGRFAVVDDEDYERINKHKRCVSGGTNYSYAYRRLRDGVTTPMHWEILLPPPGKEIDHRDRDGLNNRRDNLRICTQTQNHMNSKPYAGGTSEYKGVSRKKQNSKWLARITVNKRLIHLGYFQSEKEAAFVYNEAALKHFGEFARPNIIW